MRRRGLALAVLWIVGFEVMPWAHIALHDHLAPHHHDANGADVIDDDHDHDAEVDEHAAHHGDDLDAEVDEHGVPVHVHDVGDVACKVTNADAKLIAALNHGAHSLAHHGIAVPVPAPVVTTPLPVDRRPITLAIAEPRAWVSAAIPEAAARGPPAFLA